MKNLEAAQVKMEEKLNSLTNFIDQELQKARESPVTVQKKRNTISGADIFQEGRGNQA